MYERKQHPLLSRGEFLRRLLWHAAAALLLLVLSLLFGMWGYGYFEHLSWQDGFLNSAMLLGGMGPVDAPHTTAGKLFAGLYALYAGLIFIIAAGLVLAPTVHRAMHRFHIEEEEDRE